MSVQATSWVWDHSATKGAARLVMLCLANYAGRDGGDCYPSQSTIARDCGINVRTVRRALDECIELAEVIIEAPAGQHRSTRYRLTMTTTGDRLAVDNMENREGDMPALANPDRTSTTSRPDIHDIQTGRDARRSVKEPLENREKLSKVETTDDRDSVENPPADVPFEFEPPGGFGALKSILAPPVPADDSTE